KNLRLQLDVAAEIESSVPPPQTKRATSSGTASAHNETLLGNSFGTATAPRARPTADASFLHDKLRRHQTGLIIAAVSLLALTAALAWFIYSHRSAQAGVASVALLPFA